MESVWNRNYSNPQYVIMDMGMDININVPKYFKEKWRIDDVPGSCGVDNILANKPSHVPIVIWELVNHVEDLKMINTKANNQLEQCSRSYGEQNLNTVYELKKTSLRINQILLHLKEIKKFYRNNFNKEGSGCYQIYEEPYIYAHQAEEAGERLFSIIEARLYCLKEELTREPKTVNAVSTPQNRIFVDSVSNCTNMQKLLLPSPQ